MHLPPLAHPLLRYLGISMGLVGWLGELILLFLTHVQLRPESMVLIIAGSILGLATLVGWLGYHPPDPQASYPSGLTITDAMPEVAEGGMGDATANMTTEAVPLRGNLAYSAAGNRGLSFTRPSPPAIYNDHATEQVNLTQPSVLLPRPYAFSLPKEGLDPTTSQDKYQWSLSNERCCYAIADGVGGSFLPSRWAKIVVDSFVQLPEDFSNVQKFEEWLTPCRKSWLQWVDEWTHQIQQQRGSAYDWSPDRERGAETTFVGCSFSPLVLAQTGHINVLVTAIGDAVFFLVHPQDEATTPWPYRAFALDNPEDFGPVPQTLPSIDVPAPKVWRQVKQQIFPAYQGDCILLASDALARWILLDHRKGNNPWKKLLALPDDKAFREFVSRERSEHALERDDTTLLVIPIA